MADPKKSSTARKAAPRKAAPATTPYLSAPVAPEAAAPAEAPAPIGEPATKLEAGQLVAFTYDDFREGAGGAPMTRYGVVVDVQDQHPDGTDRLDVDGNPDPGARIAWLEPPSDPVSFHDLRVV